SAYEANRRVRVLLAQAPRAARTTLYPSRFKRSSAARGPGALARRADRHSAGATVMSVEDYSIDDLHQMATAELEQDAGAVATPARAVHATPRRVLSRVPTATRESSIMSYRCLDVACAAQLRAGPIRGDEHAFHCPGRHKFGDRHASLF